MAKNQKTEGTITVRVLSDCSLGKANDVVVVNADEVEAFAGHVDADPAAVAYAESLITEG